MIKIAQIGMNQYSHGTQVFETMRMRPDVFDVAGYCLVEDERETCAKRLKYFDGYPEKTLEEILTDPTVEAVTVETDEVHLLKYAKLALEHGKHVHMEKPGSPSLADFEALIELARAKGLVLHLGYMYRYNPMVRELLEKIRHGELGEIVSVEAQMNCYLDSKARTWLGTLPGGMMFYLGCHLVDLVMQMQGEPLRVIPMNKRTGSDGTESVDFGMAVLEYPRGNSFVKTTAVERGGFRRRQLVVTGTQGMVELKPLEIVDPTRTRVCHTTWQEYGVTDTWHTEGIRRDSEPFDRYEAMLLAFADMAQGRAQNPYSYDYEIELFRTLMQCVAE